MSVGGAEDDIPQGERKTVTDFCYLLDKSKQLFNGLRTLMNTSLNALNVMISM
uniref:Suppressor of cancer cell invasion n=1 Tax=Pipistrellus kuhlii TaxID=59472 RepID=A0A7J7SG21_PIPKU|nr:suppressor of cancer cell invasion [Pipistrellus kuhlii]